MPKNTDNTEVNGDPQQGDAPAADAPAADAPAADAPAAEAEVEVDPAPRGAAFLDHDDADASASFMGVEIVRGENGLFLVPLTAVEHLAAHGFRLVRGAE